MDTALTTRPLKPALPAAASPPSRARRAAKIVALVAGAFVAIALLFTVAANAAVSTFAAHDHGILHITIDGEPIDLDPQFHIHEGHGNMWHHHPAHLGRIFSFEPMTARQALHAMGIELSGGGVAFDGEVFDLTDVAASATVRVNGEPVDLDTHVIADGDHITVQVVSGR